MPRPIRVVVVGDEPRGRSPLRERLEREPDIEVAATPAAPPDVLIVAVAWETDVDAVATAVRDAAAAHPAGPPELPRAVCTRREREVLELVASGATNPEICERLTVSDATVRTHVQNLRRKLAARTRAELVARAFRLGLARAR